MLLWSVGRFVVGLLLFFAGLEVAYRVAGRRATVIAFLLAFGGVLLALSNR